MRAELRGGAGCRPSYCGAVQAAGQVTVGRCRLRAKLLRGGAGCGLFMWQNLRCGLTAGQVTAGRAAGSDFQPAQGLSTHVSEQMYHRHICIKLMGGCGQCQTSVS